MSRIYKINHYRKGGNNALFIPGKQYKETKENQAMASAAAACCCFCFDRDGRFSASCLSVRPVCSRCAWRVSWDWPYKINSSEFGGALVVAAISSSVCGSGRITGRNYHELAPKPLPLQWTSLYCFPITRTFTYQANNGHLWITPNVGKESEEGVGKGNCRA